VHSPAAAVPAGTSFFFPCRSGAGFVDPFSSSLAKTPAQRIEEDEEEAELRELQAQLAM
jgi:hypothetical protein